MSAANPPRGCAVATARSSVGAEPGVEPRSTVRRSRRDVERRAEQVCRVLAELIARARRRDVRLEDASPVTCADGDLPRHPILPRNDPSVNASAVPCPLARYTTSSRSVLSPPAPGRVDTRVATTRSGTRCPSNASSRSFRERSRVLRPTEIRAHLVGRDLCDVQRVADIDVAAGDLDPGVVVDREVAERVRARGGRRHE